MADVYRVKKQTMDLIASAIAGKIPGSTGFTPEQMVSAIEGLPGFRVESGVITMPSDTNTYVVPVASGVRMVILWATAETYQHIVSVGSGSACSVAIKDTFTSFGIPTLGTNQAYNNGRYIGAGITSAVYGEDTASITVAGTVMRAGTYNYSVFYWED